MISVEPYLHSRYILIFSLKPESPLHIGAGAEGHLRRIITVPVKGRMVPIIPAESLKGVLRSLASRIARATVFNTTAFGRISIDDVVRFHRKDRHAGYAQRLDPGFVRDVLTKDLKIVKEEDVAGLNPRDMAELLISLLCPIDRLFGGRRLAGKVLITDALPYNSKGELAVPRIETKTGTSISRDWGTAREGTLHSFQYIVPADSIAFKAKAIVDNVIGGEPDAVLLARLARHVSKAGLTIGGLKSKGFGRVSVDIEIVKMKLKKPRGVDDTDSILNNVRALMLREEYIERLSVEEFVRELETKAINYDE